MIAFEMAYLRLDGTSPSASVAFGTRPVLSSLTGYMHLRWPAAAMASIALVDVRIGHSHPGHRLDGSPAAGGAEVRAEQYIVVFPKTVQPHVHAALTGPQHVIIRRRT